jgi:ribosomal protein S18 acetylase RimI-like enzyme
VAPDLSRRVTRGDAGVVNDALATVMKVTLRKAVPSDVEFLYRLHRTAMQTYVIQTWGRWDEAWQSQYFHQHFNPSACQVIELHGQEIGTMCVERRTTEIVLRSIEILPAYQGQGVGTELITALLDKAAQKGIPVTLQVLKVNAARRLYERLGFTIGGETSTHYLMKALPKVGA